MFCTTTAGPLGTAMCRGARGTGRNTAHIALLAEDEVEVMSFLRKLLPALSPRARAAVLQRKSNTLAWSAYATRG